MMERKIRYAWWGVLALLLAAAGWRFFLPNNTAGFVAEKGASTREIVVYVSGAVEKPGLVRLPLDARLNDALQKVNLLPEANLDPMNPAERLKDGQKINVPYKPALQATNVPAVASGTNQSAMGTAPVVQASGPVGGTGPGVISGQAIPSGKGSASGLININTAGVAELDKLPGIGPALAERIIQYRNEHGLFSRPEDLRKVSGIGAKTYEKMASQLTVGP